jgi:hypothetical protein
VNRVSSNARPHRRRVSTLLGLAVLVLGVALLAALAGALIQSKCGGGEEARTGELALDAVGNGARPVRPSRDRHASTPIRIEIPAIDVKARVVRLGLNPDRSLEVPTNFADTGWWSGGPRPGEPGPAVIAGHVDSKTGPAAFYRIRDLRPGDAIVVERRDGSQGRFAVLGSEQYPKTDFPTARVYGPTAGPTLRLITCSGTFDQATGHYLDNTVVYANAA